MADILTETNVSLNNTMFNGLLLSLQGNILKHHGRTHAYHLFLQFKEKNAQQAREWIRQFANTKITSSFKQLDDAANKKDGSKPDGGPFFNLSLSASGYEKLEIPASLVPSADPAFISGMQNRTNVTSDDTTKWEPSLKNKIDAIIIVADANISKVTKEKDQLLFEVTDFADVVHVQKGKVLRNEHGIGIEHFGYADGVSQPNFIENNDSPASQWEDNEALLSTLLVEEPGNNEEKTFGSYFVFRKLEQNVMKFKEEETKLSKNFNKKGEEEYGIFNRHGKSNAELAGAMIVGRFEDGTAVTLHSDEFGITNEKQLENDFDYRDDNQGLKCPFHAHIRITNPRQDVGNDFAKSKRIARRGIPYNDTGRDEFNLENDQPDAGVGLLFMCYQSSIANQFEFIQQTWVNDGEIGPRRFVGQDAIIGQGKNGTEKLLNNQWGVNANPKAISPAFRDFVTMRGGEYFFTPSISFLKSL